MKKDTPTDTQQNKKRHASVGKLFNQSIHQ